MFPSSWEAPAYIHVIVFREKMFPLFYRLGFHILNMPAGL
jgi:hypothetical protein